MGQVFPRYRTSCAVYFPVANSGPLGPVNLHINFRGRMSKEDSIEVTGTVVEKFPSGLFSVQLDQDRTVLAHLAGKLRRNRIRVLAGDRVTLEMSPYDLTKGRITYRHK
jgi:translation initiation factor IF-1